MLRTEMEVTDQENCQQKAEFCTEPPLLYRASATKAENQNKEYFFFQNDQNLQPCVF